MNTWLSAALLLAAILLIVGLVSKVTKESLVLVVVYAAGGPAVLAFVAAGVVVGLADLYGYSLVWAIPVGAGVFLPALIFVRWLFK